MKILKGLVLLDHEIKSVQLNEFSTQKFPTIDAFMKERVVQCALCSF